MKKTMAFFAAAVLLVFLPLPVTGQGSVDGEKLLSEAAAAIKKEKSYKATFTYLMPGEAVSRSGVLYVSGDKYRLIRRQTHVQHNA